MSTATLDAPQIPETVPASAPRADSATGAKDESTLNDGLRKILEAAGKNKPAEVAEPKADAKPEQKPESKPEAKAKAAPDEDKVRRAMAAILRDGTLSKSRIDSWFAEDPNDFVESGLKAEKRQADADRAFHKASQYDNDRKPRGDDGRFVKNDKPQFDAKAAANKIRNDLGLTGEAAGQFDSLISHLSSEVDSLRGQLNEHHGALTSAQGAVTDLRLERERDALRERFPQLADQTHWNRVRKLANGLATTGEYETLTGLIEGACEAAFYKSDVAALGLARAKRDELIQAGQPTRPTGATPNGAGAKTPQQESDDRLRANLLAQRTGQPLPFPA